MFGIFKRKLDQAFEKASENREVMSEEELKSSLEQEMEKGDHLAMILGGYRFFLPVFIVVIILIVLIILFWK